VAQAKWSLLGIYILGELQIDAFSNMAWRALVLLEVMNTRVTGGSKFMVFHLIFFGLEWSV
jgi:hypothetical protein